MFDIEAIILLLGVDDLSTTAARGFSPPELFDEAKYNLVKKRHRRKKNLIENEISLRTMLVTTDVLFTIETHSRIVDLCEKNTKLEPSHQSSVGESKLARAAGL